MLHVSVQKGGRGSSQAPTLTAHCVVVRFVRCLFVLLGLFPRYMCMCMIACAPLSLLCVLFWQDTEAKKAEAQKAFQQERNDMLDAHKKELARITSEHKAALEKRKKEHTRETEASMAEVCAKAVLLLAFTHANTQTHTRTQTRARTQTLCAVDFTDET